MGAILTTIYAFLQEAHAFLREAFQSHPCRSCNNCNDYNDEAFFTSWRERSNLTTYANDVISSGLLGCPLKCSICGHGRHDHGTLSKSLLTADRLPNGGTVHAELHARSRRQKQQARAVRFAKETAMMLTDGGGGGSTASVQQKEDSVICKDEVVGTGRVVQSGDDVMLRYDAYLKRTMERFETSRQGGGGDGKRKNNHEGHRLTIGNGTVIPGLDEGVCGMAVGGRRRMSIPGRLAFGNEEVMGVRNADVVFIVDLLAVLSN